MAEEDKLTLLYSWSDQMTAAGQEVAKKHEDLYTSTIDLIKTSDDDKVKKLAAQLIGRFFKYFSEHEDKAFDAILDLCESEDVDMRKHATMAMITICKDSKHFVSKATDILIQLYQTTHLSEVNLINQSLMTLLNLDIKKFLHSFFLNFDDGSEIVRERALKFLSSKIHTISESSLTKEVEELLMTHSKKAMEDVTKDEFLSFICILSKLKITKTATGQAMLVLVIKSQAELDSDIDVNDHDSLDKFLLCTKHTIPLLSQYNPSSDYVNYICHKILPHLDKLAGSGHDLRILQALAEMSPHVYNMESDSKLIDLASCQKIVYDKLVEHLLVPQEQTDPPSETTNQAGETTTEPKKEEGQEKVESGTEETNADPEAPKEPTEKSDEAVGKAPVEATESTASVPAANYKFTHIEYLMYTFHQLSRLRPEFFTETLQNEIRVRLQHLALGCSRYLDLLSTIKPGEDLKREESQIRSVAIRTTKNISILVKDLFKKPPQFKNTVLLSCKPLAVSLSRTPADTEAAKRKNSLQSNNNNNNNDNSNLKNQNNNRSSSNGPRGHYKFNNNNKTNFNSNPSGGGASRQAGQKYRQNYNDHRKRPRFNKP